MAGESSEIECEAQRRGIIAIVGEKMAPLRVQKLCARVKLPGFPWKHGGTLVGR